MKNFIHYWNNLKATTLPTKINSVTIKSSREAEKIKFHKIFTLSLNADCKGMPEMQFLAAKGNVITDYHFPLHEGYQIHACNEFLRLLDTDAEVTFITYSQYADLIGSIADKLIA